MSGVEDLTQTYHDGKIVLNKVTQESADMIKGKIKMAAEAYKAAASKISVINSEYSRQFTPEAELRRIVSVKEVVDGVLSQNLMIPPDILTAQIDQLDNIQRKMHTKIRGSIDRNAKLLEYRRNIMSRRGATGRSCMIRSSQSSLCLSQRKGNIEICPGLLKIYIKK